MRRCGFVPWMSARKCGAGGVGGSDYLLTVGEISRKIDGMKVSISIQIEGPSSWEDHPDLSPFGQTILESHSCSAEFSDIDRNEAIANTIIRLIDALRSPRVVELLAKIVTGFDDESDYPAENQFFSAASEVERMWESDAMPPPAPASPSSRSP